MTQVPRPDLRRAGWDRRLSYALEHSWTAGQLARACGFDPRGVAIMAERYGVYLRNMPITIEPPEDAA